MTADCMPLPDMVTRDNTSDSGAPYCTGPIALPGAPGTASGAGGSSGRAPAGGDPKLMMAAESGAPAAPPPSSSSSSSAPTRDAELSSYSESSSLYDECLQVHPCPRPDSPYAIRFCCHLTWKPKQRTPLIRRSIPPSNLHAHAPPSPMTSI